MSWYDSVALRIVAPVSVFVAWGAVLLWTLPGVPMAPLVGLPVLLVLILVHRHDRDRHQLLWDDEAHVLAALRAWTVEVSTCRLLGTVPLGIDLTHSAERVLEAMHVHYSSAGAGELRFFVVRPHGEGPTRVGFCVHRKGLRLRDGVRAAESLKERVLVDAGVLESAMRAAYPHVPVREPSLEDMLLISTGGVRRE